jgi:hypothetical protein
MSGAVYLWKMFRAQAEQHSGVSQKVFGFIPESVFAFIPECCSESARNPVRLHPGMLFALPRNTHLVSPTHDRFPFMRLRCQLLAMIGS